MSNKGDYLEACDVTRKMIGMNLEVKCEGLKCRLCPMWIKEANCCVSIYLQRRLDNLIYKN